jgi:methylated-DNA-[protein]-cysteine S-methyltransferase
MMRRYVMKNLFFYDTPVGEIGIAEENCAVTNIFFEGEKINIDADIKETKALIEAAAQISEYLMGKRKTFSIELAPKGTEFQTKVWKALLSIPYGETRSYKEIAAATGNEKACRAVGMANNKNPIPIIIPCHRVIGSNGSMVGYAGGLETKKFLLNLENKIK